jgi:hypothetical protein
MNNTNRTKTAISNYLSEEKFVWGGTPKFIAQKKVSDIRKMKRMSVFPIIVSEVGKKSEYQTTNHLNGKLATITNSGNVGVGIERSESDQLITVGPTADFAISVMVDIINKVNGTHCRNVVVIHCERN